MAFGAVLCPPGPAQFYEPACLARSARMFHVAAMSLACQFHLHVHGVHLIVYIVCVA